MTITNTERLQRRRARVRAKVSGTAARPRLAVKVSSRHIIAQLIDDTTGTTLAYVSTISAKQTGTMTAKAQWIGAEIAKAGKAKKVTTVVFDRAGRIYHGRLDALATAARSNGLEF